MKIQTILVPTVPMIERSIGIAEYPIPRSAPGKRSISPHIKISYGSIQKYFHSALNDFLDLKYRFLTVPVRRDMNLRLRLMKRQRTAEYSSEELCPFVSIFPRRSSGL